MIADAIAQHHVAHFHDTAAAYLPPDEQHNRPAGHIAVPMVILLTVGPWVAVALLAWSVFAR